MKPRILLIFVVLGICQMVSATPNLSVQSVKQLYKDGEFEKVRTQLENFLKKADATATRDERILAYKYLGVVYASKPDGAPQAEAYFFRLLDLSPMVQLTEMYVSSSVNDLFERTQRRFLKEKRVSQSVDELGHPINPSQDQGNPSHAVTDSMGSANTHHTVVTKRPIRNTSQTNIDSEKKPVKIWPWVLGATIVGGGIGVYVMTSSEDAKKRETVFAGTPGK